MGNKKQKFRNTKMKRGENGEREELENSKGSKGFFLKCRSD